MSHRAAPERNAQDRQSQAKPVHEMPPQLADRRNGRKEDQESDVNSALTGGSSLASDMPALSEAAASANTAETTSSVEGLPTANANDSTSISTIYVESSSGEIHLMNFRLGLQNLDKTSTEPDLIIKWWLKDTFDPWSPFTMKIEPAPNANTTLEGGSETTFTIEHPRAVRTIAQPRPEPSIPRSAPHTHRTGGAGFSTSSNYRAAISAAKQQLGTVLSRLQHWYSQEQTAETLYPILVDAVPLINGIQWPTNSELPRTSSNQQTQAPPFQQSTNQPGNGAKGVDRSQGTQQIPIGPGKAQQSAAVASKKPRRFEVKTKYRCPFAWHSVHACPNTSGEMRDVVRHLSRCHGFYFFMDCSTLFYAENNAKQLSATHKDAHKQNMCTNEFCINVYCLHYDEGPHDLVRGAQGCVDLFKDLDKKAKWYSFYAIIFPDAEFPEWDDVEIPVGSGSAHGGAALEQPTDAASGQDSASSRDRANTPVHYRYAHSTDDSNVEPMVTPALRSVHAQTQTTPIATEVNLPGIAAMIQHLIRVMEGWDRRFDYALGDVERRLAVHENILELQHAAGFGLPQRLDDVENNAPVPNFPQYNYTGSTSDSRVSMDANEEELDAMEDVVASSSNGASDGQNASKRGWRDSGYGSMRTRH